MSKDLEREIDLAIMELTAMHGSLDENARGRVLAILSKTRNAIHWEREFGNKREKAKQPVSSFTRWQDRRWAEAVKHAREHSKDFTTQEQPRPGSVRFVNPTPPRDLRFEGQLTLARIYAKEKSRPYYIVEDGYSPVLVKPSGDVYELRSGFPLLLGVDEPVEGVQRPSP